MAEAATPLMSQAEFFAWIEHQDERYELVAGRARLMTGATQRHDLVVVNALAALLTKLRGGPCRPTTDDIAVIARNGNVRRPDLTVECGPMEPNSVAAKEPVLVLEVLSPSTADVDRFIKLEEYKDMPSIDYILFADGGRAHVVIYVRGTDRGWSQLSHIGMDAVLELPKIGCTLPLADLYEDVPVAAAPF